MINASKLKQEAKEKWIPSKYRVIKNICSVYGSYTLEYNTVFHTVDYIESLFLNTTQALYRLNPTLGQLFSAHLHIVSKIVSFLSLFVRMHETDTVCKWFFLDPV